MTDEHFEQLLIRLPATLKAELREYAQFHSTSMTQTLVQFAREGLRRARRREAR